MVQSARSTITLPKVRLHQLEQIAQKRDLPNAAALIEAWITRAAAEGEIEPGLPGFSCQTVGGKLLITVAGHVLPMMAPDRARMLAALLSAAAGETDPKLPFEMPAGRPIPLKLDGDEKMLVGRVGRGIRLLVKRDPDVDGVPVVTSPTFAIELARLIRIELGEDA